MELTARGLLLLARDSVTQPREAARQVLALRLTLPEAWLALVLMAVGSALAVHLTLLLQPLPQGEPMAALFASPVRTAILQALVLSAGAWAMFWFGQRRGGAGTLPQAVTLIALFQFVLLVVQLAQLVVEVALPPLGAALALASLVLVFWLLTAFTMELHGFTSGGTTLLGVLAVMLALGMVLVPVLGMFIDLPQGTGNV